MIRLSCLKLISEVKSALALFNNIKRGRREMRETLRTGFTEAQRQTFPDVRGEKRSCGSTFVGHDLWSLTSHGVSWQTCEVGQVYIEFTQEMGSGHFVGTRRHFLFPTGAEQVVTSWRQNPIQTVRSMSWRLRGEWLIKYLWGLLGMKCVWVIQLHTWQVEEIVKQ